MRTVDTLQKAKTKKDDEYYTLYEDIEKILLENINYWKDKIVHCNCDDEKSNFYKFIKNNFEKLKLKKAVFTSINDKKIIIDKNGETLCNTKNGYENNYEDGAIIVTNPPFSKLNHYFDMLLDQKKQFLIITGINFLTTINCFNEFKNKKVKVLNSISNFLHKSGKKKSVCCFWITNISELKKSKKKICKNNNFKYLDEKYDGKRIINIDTFNLVNKCYKKKYELIAAPITFLINTTKKYEIIKVINPGINGKKIFKRVLCKIKKKLYN